MKETSHSKNKTWEKVYPLLLGQILSICITSTGITSQYLSEKGVNTPTAQSFLNYLLVCIFGLILTWKNSPPGTSCKIFWFTKPSNPNSLHHKLVDEEVATCSTEEENKDQVSPKSVYDCWVPWKKGLCYFLFSCADVEANYLVVKAYQYTNITSIMLLDCFTIPCVMALSKFFLKSTYNWKQLLGVIICLIGLVTLVLSDYFYDPDESTRSTSQAVFGDVLCIFGSILYSISNVGQEGMVRRYGRHEWLSSLGFFAFFLSGIQLTILERKELETLHWSVTIVFLYLGFILALFILYAWSPVMMLKSSATLFNLSLLTSDAFAILAAIFLFDKVPSFLYFIALFIIVCGLIVYNWNSQNPAK